MKETQLKKQFTERDLQRIRNLVQKKGNEKTITSVGYTKAEERHNEGDVWEENGKTWTIKNGVKRTFRKTEGTAMPLLCPKCSNPEFTKDIVKKEEIRICKACGTSRNYILAV
jgi:hypothetical protein